MVDDEHSVIEKREYQEKILRLINSNVEKKKNVILELDCGMGKRILQYLLINQYSKFKMAILLHSTSSLQETHAFFDEKYHSNQQEVFFVSSSTSSQHRLAAFQEYRVIGATPQIFASIIEKLQGTGNALSFDIIIINEVDKIVKRLSDTHNILVFPYDKILRFCEHSLLIGMSGTLRDQHVELGSHITIRKDLETLIQVFPHGGELVSMDMILEGTDAKNFLATTRLLFQPVDDPKIRALMQELDTRIREFREAILVSLEKEDTEILHQLDQENIPWLTQYLPVNDDLKSVYTTLLLLRKYVTAMTPAQFKRFLWQVKHIIDPLLFQNLSESSPKIRVLMEIFQRYSKCVVICSYVRTAEEIQTTSEKHGIPALIVTGKVQDKRPVLATFAQWERGVLILTPVGERDLDITSGDVLISYDTINTPKTMYQRFKRTRGGDVISLYFSGTSEERKIHRLYSEIKERYPWSVIVEK